MRTVFLMIISLASFAMIAHDTTSFDEKYSLLIQELNYYEEMGYDKEVGHSIMELVVEMTQFLYANGKKDTLYKFVDKVKLNARGSGDKDLLANILNIEGVYSFQFGDFQKAIQSYTEAIEYYHQSDDSIGVAEALVNLGLTQKRVAEYQESLSSFIEATDYIGSENKILKAKCFNNIGSILRELNEPIRALEYQKRALFLYRNNNDSLNLASTFNSLGLTFKETGNLDSAIHYLKLALSIKRNLKELKPISTTLHNIGLVYLTLNLDSAWVYLDSARSIKSNIKDRYGLSSLNIDMARLFMSKGDFTQARNYLLESEHQAKLIDSPKLLYENFKVLSDLGYRMGDIELFHTSSQKYDSIKEVIYKIETKKEIERLDAIYQNRLKTKELWLKDQSLQFHKVKLAQEKYKSTLLIIAFGLAVLIIIAIALIYRQRRRLLIIRSQKEKLKARQRGEEEEKKKIASFLHDEIGGILGTSSMILGQMAKKHSEVAMLKVREKIDEVYDLVRFTSHRLASFQLFEITYVEALQDFFEGLAELRNTRINFTYSKDEKTSELPDEIQIFTYRTVQELTFNAIKHSKSSIIDVTVRIDKELLFISVSDDGRGIGNYSKTGLGLSNIKKGVLELLGKFDLTNLNGTRIEITIPL